MIQTNCPSCGAQLTFQASHSLLAVCDYCKSTIIRQDLDLENIGKMSDVREDHSPLQIGVTGNFGGTSFTVVGRLQVRYEQGLWSEWHCLLGSGESAWIGESNGQLSFLQRSTISQAVHYSEVELGDEVNLDGMVYTAVEKRVARVVGAQGELPYQVLGDYELPFIDLRNKSGRLATLDFSDDEASAYAGPLVRLKDLNAKNLRYLSGFAAGRTDTDGNPVEIESEAFNCPNCASAINVSVQGQSQRVGCPTCGSLLSLEDNNLNLLNLWRERVSEPLIPLGSVGKFEGVDFTVIGMVRKTIREQGIAYFWHEFLLFNAYEGYRWLVESQGHFTFMEPCLGLPNGDPFSSMQYRGTSFRFFQRSTPSVKYVLGEFYWQVEIGQATEATDYAAPPHLLSSEKNDNETVWTVGTYIEGHDIWSTFQLDGKPPTSYGVAPNQPFDPDGRFKKLRQTFLVYLALLFLGTALSIMLSDNSRVASVSKVIEPTTSDPTTWSEPFEIKGQSQAVEISSQANGLDNQYLYLSLALVNEETGKVFQTAHELSYYHGAGWSEGKHKDSTLFGPVEGGRYVLRVNPLWDKLNGKAPEGYTINVIEDPVRVAPSIFAFILLILIPGAATLYQLGFEGRRWNPE